VEWETVVAAAYIITYQNWLGYDFSSFSCYQIWNNWGVWKENSFI